MTALLKYSSGYTDYLLSVYSSTHKFESPIHIHIPIPIPISSCYQLTMLRLHLVTFLSLLIPISCLAQLFTLHPHNTTRLVDTDFRIDCSIIASEITIRWRKDGNILSPSSSSYEIVTVVTSTGLSSQFHVYSGEFSNTGVYSCLAYNDSVFIEESYSGILTMDGPVQYIEEPLDQIVYINQPIILICHIQGGPLPSLTWTYDVTEGTIDVISGGLISIITNGINSYETLSTLTIANVQNIHDSIYHCETENSYGSADRTARITVQEQEVESVSITQPVHGTVYTLIAHNINSITLPCTATGLPMPTLSWDIPTGVQTANVRINQATLIPILYITAPTLQDAGVYTCTANNTLTHDVASIEVIVIETPVVSASSDIIISSGSSVTLFCSATGTPAPTVSLIHPNASVLTPDVNGLVTLSVTTYRDGGSYRCVAVTYTVSSETNFELTVLGEPVFVAQPTDTGVGIGQDAKFDCVVTGSPTPVITWVFNTYTTLTVPIQSVLRITNVHSNDQGEYTCIATNQFNSVNATAILTIFPFPQFNVTPVTTLAGVDESVAFYCSATPATATIEWYVDNTLITSGIKYFASSGNLLIHNLMSSDTNQYICRISNPAGISEASAILTVIQRPVFLQTPADQTVSPGTQVTFSCTVTSTPTPTLSWLDEEGNVIYTDGKFNVSLASDTITLVISDVSLTEAAVYTCTADNGLKASSSARLSIINIPQITINPFKQNAILGQQFILTCLVIYSIPSPTFQWYKDSVIITTDTRVKSFTNGSLVLDTTLYSDAGEYLCIAINSVGTATARGQVEIIVTPTFTPTPTGHLVALRSDISLPCNSEGVPTPVTSWLLSDNSTVPNNEHFSWTLQANGPLTIRNVLATDQDSYTCLSTNEAGTATLRIFLTVQIPPSIPYNISAVVLYTSSVTVSWVTPFDGYSVVTGYRIEQLLEGGGVVEAVFVWEETGVGEGEFDSAVVTGLIPFEFYRFRVSAVNEIGAGNFSNFSTPIQLPPNYPPAPENVTVLTLNSTAIQLTWSPPTYTHGIILEYIITWGVINTNQPTTITVPLSQGLQHVFSSLYIYTEYMFSVRAVNNNPAGDPFKGLLSQPVYEFTGEEPPNGPPLNLALVTAPGGILVRWNAPLSEFRLGVIIAYNLFYRESQLNLILPTLPPIIGNQTNHSLEIRNDYRMALIEYYQFGNLSFNLMRVPVSSESESHSYTLTVLPKEDYFYDIKLQAVNSAGAGPNSTLQTAKSGFITVNLLPILLPSILGSVLIILSIPLCVLGIFGLYRYYDNWKESATNRKPYRDVSSARKPLVAPSSSLQESNFEKEKRGFDDIIRKHGSAARKRDSPTSGNDSYLSAINEINRQIMQSVDDSEHEDTDTGTESSGSMSGINTEVFTSNKQTDSDGAHVIYNYDSVMPKVGQEKTGTTKQTDFDDDIGDKIREVPVLQGGNYSDDDSEVNLADSRTPGDFYPHENSDLSDDERVSYGDYVKNVSGQEATAADSEVSVDQYSHISFEFSRAKRQMANLKQEDRNIKLERKRLDQEKKMREKIALRERKARESRAKTERKEREKEAKLRLKERQHSYLPPSSLDPDLKYKEMSANKNRDVLF